MGPDLAAARPRTQMGPRPFAEIGLARSWARPRQGTSKTVSHEPDRVEQQIATARPSELPAREAAV